MVFQEGRAFWRDVSPAVPPRQLPTGAEHCPEGQHCRREGAALWAAPAAVRSDQTHAETR